MSEQLPLFVLAFERGASLDTKVRKGRRAKPSYVLGIRDFLKAMDQCELAATRGSLRLDTLLDAITSAAPDCAVPFERVCQLLADIEFKRGYVHGDFVPKNVLVGRSGNLKILDWEYAMANGYRVVDAMDMALQLVSDDPRMASFQVLDAAWGEEGGVTRLGGMLHRLWPAASDELRNCGIQAISLLYLMWCAWRFARAGWPGPIRQCADVADRVLASSEPRGAGHDSRKLLRGAASSTRP